MIQSQINLIIDSLGVWYDDSSQRLDPRQENEYASMVGYAIDPLICNLSLHNYIESKNINVNSTFYKTWEDITSKNRLELYIDQILHYISTYGSGFNGPAYVPNNEPLQIDYTKYTVIKCVGRDELISRILDIISSNIALKSDLSDALGCFLEDSVQKGYEVDLNVITNKEVKYNIMARLGIIPKTSDGFRRYVNYLLVKKPQIIQSRRELSIIRCQLSGSSDVKRALKIASENDELTQKLASEFLRYRKWWCSIKKAVDDDFSRSYINSLRRLSKKVHKPFIPNFWEALTRHTEKYVIEHIENEIDKLSSEPFKIVRLLEMLRLLKTQSYSKSDRIFKIRNGLVYKTTKKTIYHKWYDNIAKLLLDKLISIVSKKRELDYGVDKHPCIKFPENITIMAPSSGKNFVGNYPFGSYINLSNKNTFIGCYWRNEWGTHDFDLSLIGYDGYKIGWNGGYDDGGIIFSGDMTDADPEACELLSIKKKCPDGIVCVNRYHGEIGSKYKLIFGVESIKNIYKNYMVNPDNIEVCVDCISDKALQHVGFIKDGKCYLMMFSGSSSRVAYSNNSVVDSWRDQVISHIPLKEILLSAGYREYPTGEENLSGIVEPDIDLTNMSKDSLLTLFK